LLQARAGRAAVLGVPLELVDIADAMTQRRRYASALTDVALAREVLGDIGAGRTWVTKYGFQKVGSDTERPGPDAETVDELAQSVIRTYISYRWVEDPRYYPRQLHLAAIGRQLLENLDRAMESALGSAAASDEQISTHTPRPAPAPPSQYRR
jgi:hypothetical protein